jgi:predicted nucleic acid-binding protein
LSVPDPPVANASPLIILAKAGYLDLLRLAGSSVLVPRAVLHEVQQPGPSDPVARAIVHTAWLTIVDPGSAPAALKPFGLDLGEEAVLTWALTHPGTEALIDDLAARRAAKFHNIPHRGCLGLVLTAKRNGVFSLARPIVDELRAAGLRLSDRVMNQALTLVGE